jgi:hypothetical protein
MTRIQIINLFIKINKYKTYLEIGVNTPAQPGYSHDSIEIETKHGVDPAVDTTYKMTSDDFFKDHIKMKYDIIFIDGLHIFEQAYRDIVNSLEYLNENGTIIVHDCNPLKEITQRRERASSVWHGDVWKAILKLRIENPNVIIYTVNTDEGCTIIKKGSQKLYTPQENIKNIYDFNYFKSNKKEILNLISVREFRNKLGISTWFDKKLNFLYKINK